MVEPPPATSLPAAKTALLAVARKEGVLLTRNTCASAEALRRAILERRASAEALKAKMRERGRPSVPGPRTPPLELARIRLVRGLKSGPKSGIHRAAEELGVVRKVDGKRRTVEALMADIESIIGEATGVLFSLEGPTAAQTASGHDAKT